MKPKTSLGRFSAFVATELPPPIAELLALPDLSGESARRGRKPSGPAVVKPLLVRLGEADHKRLKRRAVDEGITMQELMLRGADAYLRSNGLPGLERR